MNPPLRILSCSLALALLALPSTARGQESTTTQGFILGAHLSGASLGIEDQERNEGGGLGLQAGYGLNRNFTLFVQLDGARVDEQRVDDTEGRWDLGHVDLGVRYHFVNSLRSWVPYVQAALDYRALTLREPAQDGGEDEITISGQGLSLGGGLGFYFNPSLALDVQLLWSGGEFGSLTVENVTVSGFDVDASSTRLNLGVSWWP